MEKKRNVNVNSDVFADKQRQKDSPNITNLSGKKNPKILYDLPIPTTLGFPCYEPLLNTFVRPTTKYVCFLSPDRP